jgi:hypothetical protein
MSSGISLNEITNKEKWRWLDKSVFLKFGYSERRHTTVSQNSQLKIVKFLHEMMLKFRAEFSEFPSV